MHDTEAKLKQINDLLDGIKLFGIDDTEKSFELAKSAVSKMKDIKDRLFYNRCEFKVLMTTIDTAANFGTHTHLQAIKVLKGSDVLFKKSSGGDGYIDLDPEEIEKINKSITTEKAILDDEGYSEEHGNIIEKNVLVKAEIIARLHEFEKKKWHATPFQGLKD